MTIAVKFLRPNRVTNGKTLRSGMAHETHAWVPVSASARNYHQNKKIEITNLKRDGK
jgi:hypothetical protein